MDPSIAPLSSGRSLYERILIERPKGAIETAVAEELAQAFEALVLPPGQPRAVLAHARAIVRYALQTQATLFPYPVSWAFNSQPDSRNAEAADTILANPSS